MTIFSLIENGEPLVVENNFVKTFSEVSKSEVQDSFIKELMKKRIYNLRNSGATKMEIKKDLSSFLEECIENNLLLGSFEMVNHMHEFLDNVYTKESKIKDSIFKKIANDFEVNETELKTGLAEFEETINNIAKKCFSDSFINSF